jgi:hypothetical protein
MAKWKSGRISVYFGELTTKEKKADGTIDKIKRSYVVKVRPEIVEKLNLPLATKEQQFRTITVNGDPRKARARGCKGGKFIRVPDPVDKKTAKGHTKYLQLPVPSNATIDDIETFLTPTKADSFSILGGGSYSSTGAAGGAAAKK